MVRLANITRESRWPEEDVYERLIFSIRHERVGPELGVCLRMVDRAAWIVADVAKKSTTFWPLYYKCELHVRFEAEDIRIRSIVDPRARIHALRPNLIDCGRGESMSFIFLRGDQPSWSYWWAIWARKDVIIADVREGCQRKDIHHQSCMIPAGRAL